MPSFRLTTFLLMIAAALSATQTRVAAQQDHAQFIPSSAMMAILANPMDAIAQPSMELFPYEVATAMGKKEMGIDPCNIKHFSLIIDSIENMDRPPGFGMVLEFATAQKIEGMSDNVLRSFRKGNYQGKTIYESDGGDEVPSFYQYDDSTIIMATKPFLKKMLNAKGAQSKLISLVSERNTADHLCVFMTIEPVRGLIKENLPPADRVPPPFRNLFELPDLVDSVAFRSDFANEGTSALHINTASEQDAKRIHDIMIEGMETGKQVALMQLQDTMRNEAPEFQESVQQYVNRLGKYIQDRFQPGFSEDGRSLVFETEMGSGGASVATIGVLTGMLLPAVQQVREAARRTSSANNLRQLALACHNHESAYKELPRQAIYSEDGEPLLSWRVKILPFMEENALYEKFHLDEPWDSEHNIKLLDEMPMIYRCPSSVFDNRTVYLALVGENTVMSGKDERNRFAQITDGSSNTILFVEANDDFAVEWTKPTDLDFDPENPMRGVGSIRPEGFNAAFCDGSIHFIDRFLDSETFKALASKNGGEIADW